MNKNAIDLLLKSDVSKIKRPTRKVKIKSLSEALGEDIIFTLQAVPMSIYNSIQESCVSLEDDEINNIDTNKIQLLTVLEGIKEPDLKSKELIEHFKTHTPIELLETMFNDKPGEIAALYKEINELSGFGKGVIEEIKNS
ncbi:phage tail assembly chaperone [Clostridium rectalis]|uniref:phage tail assembly chaperone n=1 Tax=Clostridium rectalis TaxID=2040295 RepID=UPI000F63DE82|nr:XkdN-like protein [Clostridium rectalis]